MAQEFEINGETYRVIRFGSKVYRIYFDDETDAYVGNSDYHKWVIMDLEQAKSFKHFNLCIQFNDSGFTTRKEAIENVLNGWDLI